MLTVKGQELPAHMPHVKRSLGLIYATNPFGADHQSSEHDPAYHPKTYERSTGALLAPLGLTAPQPTKALNEDKVTFALKTQYTYSSADTVSLCQFVFGPGGWQIFGPQQIADVLTAATGWEFDIDAVQELGRRRLNMMRAFNAREGLSRDHDTLPKKLFKNALKGGRSEGLVLEEAELANGLDMYYAQAGWDVATGTPTRETLAEVGLEWVADDLGM